MSALLHNTDYGATRRFFALLRSQFTRNSFAKEVENKNGQLGGVFNQIGQRMIMIRQGQRVNFSWMILGNLFVNEWFLCMPNSSASVTSILIDRKRCVRGKSAEVTRVVRCDAYRVQSRRRPATPFRMPGEERVKIRIFQDY